MQGSYSIDQWSCTQDPLCEQVKVSVEGQGQSHWIVIGINPI